MRASAQVLPLLFLVACPPILHVYVVNLSEATVTLGYLESSYPLKPGETQKIVGTNNTDGWRVEQGGLVHAYDSRLEVPTEYTAKRGLYVIVRLGVDAKGRLWLLPSERDADPRPVEPQPSGFPIEPSQGVSAPGDEGSPWRSGAGSSGPGRSSASRPG